ncbi:hypothetical protein BDW67DRAFT_37381 [Aspergillus spinulosporus]
MQFISANTTVIINNGRPPLSSSSSFLWGTFSLIKLFFFLTLLVRSASLRDAMSCFGPRHLSNFNSMNEGHHRPSSPR